jgi:hypothetical protein
LLPVLALGCSLAAKPAWAQRARQAPPSGRSSQSESTSGKWTVEVYGGGHIGSGSTSGTPSVGFPSGQSFTTRSGFPSRSVSSWYFGDGALLFNQVNAQFASRFGQVFDEIRPLDDLLGSAGARRQSEGAFGVRLTRVLSPRLGVEISIGRNTGSLKLTTEAQDAVEATRASFETAFTGLLNTVPQTGLGVTSTVNVVEPGGASTLVSGALVFSLARRDRLEAYAVAGVGRFFGGSEALEVRLRGNYEFSIFGMFPINETDEVTMRVTDDDSATIGVFGGGVTYGFSSRHGLRVDLRLLAGGNGTQVSVKATPSVSPTNLSSFLPSNTDPTVQFSTDPGVRSSLSGGPLERTTFRGSGLDVRPQFTVGYFFRF